MPNTPQRTATGDLFGHILDSIEELLVGNGYISFTGEFGQSGFVRLWEHQSKSPSPLVIFSATETKPGRYLVEIKGGAYIGHNHNEFSVVRIEAGKDILRETILKENAVPFLQCVEYARKVAESLDPQDLTKV